MVKVNDVLKTIDDNVQLAVEDKVQLKELVNTYIGKVSQFVPNINIDIETLNFKMANLKIEPAPNKYIIKKPLKYVDAANTIYVNESEINNGYDYEYLLMREILLMQTYKLDINKVRNEKYAAIYEGYASIWSNIMRGNNGVDPYEDEQIAVNLLGQILGKDSIALDELLFNNNDYALVKALENKGISHNHLNQLLEDMNCNLGVRDNERGKSLLGTVQRRLTTMFYMQSDLTLENIEDFRANLFGNNIIFENNAHKYGDINTVYQTFDELVANYELKSENVKTR